MNLINRTKMIAGFTMFTDKTGREHVVVVAKGTFGFPDRPEQEPNLLQEQAPLVMCDEYTGEPGCSAPLYEMDFAPRKPRCDVLLNGSAYAPGGKPAQRVTVSLRVGVMTKSFDVVGNRVFRVGMVRQAVSDVVPFNEIPISYNNAFGGVDRTSKDPTKHRWFLANHAGVGFYVDTSGEALNGKPLPNTEETGRPVTSASGNYKPMAFGPIGRSWQSRIRWAGTYNQEWLKEKYPFLPDDFDERYFQCAAEDQQTSYLQGGEVVELINLTPEGRTAFRLPTALKTVVLVFLRSGEVKEVEADLDTMLLEPDRRRLMLTWRAAHPVRRTVHEIQQLVVGRTASEWEIEQRRQGKLKFPSLRAMDEARLAGSTD
jgi:hypothetical protein